MGSLFRTEYGSLLRPLLALNLIEVGEGRPPKPRAAVAEIVWEFVRDNQAVLCRWDGVRDADADIQTATALFVSLTRDVSNGMGEEESFWLALMDALGEQCVIRVLTLSDAATLAALVLWERSEREEARRGRA